MTVISRSRRSEGSRVVFTGRALTSWPSGWFQTLGLRFLPGWLKALPPFKKYRLLSFSIQISNGLPDLVDGFDQIRRKHKAVQV